MRILLACEYSGVGREAFRAMGRGRIQGCSMTASEEAKKAGLNNLIEIMEMTNTSRQTLINWYKNKPELFAVVVAGCAAIKSRN